MTTLLLRGILAALVVLGQVPLRDADDPALLHLLRRLLSLFFFSMYVTRQAALVSVT